MRQSCFVRNDRPDLIVPGRVEYTSADPFEHGSSVLANIKPTRRMVTLLQLKQDNITIGIPFCCIM